MNSHPRFHDISTLFDDSEEPRYWDHCHTSETGNQLIAEAMVDDVVALIERAEWSLKGRWYGDRLPGSD